MMARQRTLEAYEQAWARADGEDVRDWVEQCCTPASIYVNPLTDVVHGVDGLTRLIWDYPVLFPDARLRRRSEPQLQDQHVRFPWRLTSSAPIRMLGEDFGRVMDGVDIIEFDDDEKIKTVVSIFGSSSERAPEDGPDRIVQLPPDRQRSVTAGRI